MNDWKVLVVAGALLAACGGSDEDTPTDAGTDTDTGGTGDVALPDAGDPDTTQPDSGEPDVDAGAPDVVPDVVPDIVEDIVEPDVNDATDGSSEPDVVVPPPEPSSCVEIGEAFEGEDRREVSFDGEGRVLLDRTDYGFGGYDVVEYTYDADGRVLTEKTGYGSGTSGGYESMRTITYSADAPSLAGSFTQDEDSDADGTVDSTSTGTQDEFGRLLTQSTLDSEETLLREVRYTYASDDPEGDPIGEYQDYDGNGIADVEVIPTVEGGLLVSQRSISGETEPFVSVTTFAYDDEDRLISTSTDDDDDDSVDSLKTRNWVSDDEFVEQTFAGGSDVPIGFRRVVYFAGTLTQSLEQTLIPDICSYTQFEYDAEGQQSAYEGGGFSSGSAGECVSIVLAGVTLPGDFSRIEYGPSGPTRDVADADGDGTFETIKVTTYLDEGYIESETVTTGGAEPVVNQTKRSDVARNDGGMLTAYSRFDNGSDTASQEYVWTYNEDGLVATLSETQRFGESTQTDSYAYTYDDEGRVTEEVYTISFTDGPVTTTTTYTGPFPFDSCRASDEILRER